MGLAGAVNSAVTGLQSQSTNIAISSDNIANASTIGYKSVQGVFSTLVTTPEGSTSFSSGGVSITPQTLVDQQGLIQPTNSGTDLAISGKGFFSVQDTSGNLLLTRAGSFTIQNDGKLKNSAGYTLLGWPLDNDGRLPGVQGNVNTISADSTGSLEAINTLSASGNASPTTSIKLGMNLNSASSTYQGSTVTIAPASLINSAISKTDILIPGEGMQEGDQFSLSSNSSSYRKFLYGGFAQSKDLSVSSSYGAATSTTTFSTGTNLSEGDRFTITTSASGTVTFKFVQINPDTSRGQFNSLATLATAINSATGLTARTDDNSLYVSSKTATDAVTFANTSGTLVEGLGLSNVSAALIDVNRFNTMSGLSTLVNKYSEISSQINTSGNISSLDIYSSSPLLELKLTKIPNAVTLDLQSNLNGNNTPTSLIVPVPTNSGVTSTMIPDTTGLLANTQNAATLTLSDGTTTKSVIYGGIGSSKDITSATIFGASTSSTQFVVGGGLTNGEIITFSDGTNSVPCTYTTTAGTPAAGSFNSLDTLAAAINRTGVINARVENNKLYIASVDQPNANLTATSTTSLTGAQMAVAFGGTWSNVGGNVANLVTAKTTGLDRFNTMAQLNGYISGTTGFTTTAPSGSNCLIPISTATATQITIGGAQNAQLLKELGVASGGVGDGFFTEMGLASTFASNSGTISNPATISVTYDPTDKTKNMASGNISPTFVRNIAVYDSLGTNHSFTMAFLKTGANTWAVEMYAVKPTDISNDTNGQGLIASGTVTFNGDGSLATVSSGLQNNIGISWTGGSVATAFTLNLGTAGLPAGTAGATVIGSTDGMRQFNAQSNVDSVQQNGVAAGQYNGISIDDKGVISAKFSNGQIKAIYKLPVVIIANPNGLFQKTGNVFAITQASGDANLKQAGFGGAGVITPDALEGSTADISSELTKTISIQANYNANATLISTVKSMEQELNQRL
jgi:flagellar hook protein FlgE